MVLHSAAVILVLHCDIQPGALRDRYSIEWRALQHNNTFYIISVDSYHLFLSVNASLNGSQYQCEVTIDHDGIGVSMTYEGSTVTVITVDGMYIIRNY